MNSSVSSCSIYSQDLNDLTNDNTQTFQRSENCITFANNCKQKNVDTVIEDDSVWLSGKLKDELYIGLVSIKKDGKRKYEEQAKYLLVRIPVYHPTPYFIINESDLSPRLIKELASLNDLELDEVIKDVLSWIFESINKDSFLLSIRRNNLLRWRIEP